MGVAAAGGFPAAPLAVDAATAAYLVISALLALTVTTGIVRAVVTAIGIVRGTDVLSVRIVTFEDFDLPPRFEIAGPTPIRYVMDDPSAAEIVLATAPALLWWLGAVAMLWLLRAIARSATRGDPLQLANVRRLRQLGLLLALGYPGAVILEGLLTNWLFSAGVWETGRPSPDFTIEFPVEHGPTRSGEPIRAGPGVRTRCAAP